MANSIKSTSSKAKTSSKSVNPKRTLSGKAALVNRNSKSTSTSGTKFNSNVVKSNTKSSISSLVNKPTNSVLAQNSSKTATTKAVESKARNSASINIDQKTVKLVLTKIAPASAAKIGFFISIAMGIVMIVAGVFFWLLLDKSGIILQLAGSFASSGLGDGGIASIFTLDKVIIICLLIACVNCALITLLSIVIACIYNVASSLAGGLKLHFIKG